MLRYLASARDDLFDILEYLRVKALAPKTTSRNLLWTIAPARKNKSSSRNAKTLV